MNASYTAKEGGYAYLYVSNEHPTQLDVYFDDIAMSYTPSRIIQSNEYYPFGAQTARSWTRESAVTNNFLGNGGTEYNATSSQYDLDFRNYDPILGRLNQVDPMSSKYGGLSPYHLSFNNPVTWNDPSGADTFDGANVPKGPYEAGTLWSHNWFTGRPANYEGGHLEANERAFWKLREDAYQARYGAGSLQEYGFKYGQTMSSESATQIVQAYQEYYRNTITLPRGLPKINNKNLTASSSKGAIHSGNYDPRDPYVRRSQKFSLNAGTAFVFQAEEKGGLPLPAGYIMDLTVSTFKVGSEWQAKVSAISFVTASAGQVTAIGVVSLIDNGILVGEFMLSPGSGASTHNSGQYSYIGETYITLPNSYSNVQLNFTGTWQVSVDGLTQVPFSLSQPFGISVSQSIKLN